jgi:hypothetical protein
LTWARCGFACADIGIGQKRLEDLILVGIDGSLHDVLTESPRCVDEHDLVKTAFGVDGEHDAGTASIGTNHALYTNGEGDICMAESLGLSIADCPISEE